MKSQLRFIFIVFYLTAVSIFTVQLHTAQRSIFYQLRAVRNKESQLKQILWQKQLQLESLINPAAMSKIIENQNNIPED